MDAQKGKKKGESGNEYFLVEGVVYEIDPLEETEGKASEVQLVVYQEKEIYVAFYTAKTGAYNFYLPVGHDYLIWYGGSSYVNKKVEIEGTKFPTSEKPQKVQMDIALFRPIEGYEFPMLDEPFVKVVYHTDDELIGPDMKYTDERVDLLGKQVKKIQKEVEKKKKQEKS